MNCKVIYTSLGPQLSQLFTGFGLLNKAGVIRLSQECGNNNFIAKNENAHYRNARNSDLLVLLNDDVRVFYDTQDSHEIDEFALKQVDLYFKRSYAPTKIPKDFEAKIFPLGLNYPVYADGFDIFEIGRIVSILSRQIRSLYGVVRFLNQATKLSLATFSYRPTTKNIYSAPEQLQTPRVLFMARAWDPINIPNTSKEKQLEIIDINNTRAKCIELLRKEFGQSFTGGFQHTDYARKNFAHVLLHDDKLSSKRNYINLLKHYPICIATTGLHGSIGWKVGEYVAFSKAIVSERLNYSVCGDFSHENNYLEFETPEQCVEQSVKLFQDADLRYQMMRNNYQYYLSYLKPDAMVQRTLNIALSKE